MVPNEYQLKNARKEHGNASADEFLYNLKGYIKTIKVSRYRVYPDTMGLKERHEETSVYFFDKNHRIREELLYLKKDTPRSHTWYFEFDNRSIDSVVYYSPDGSTDLTEKYYYADSAHSIRMGTVRIEKGVVRDKRFQISRSNDTVYLTRFGNIKRVYEDKELGWKSEDGSSAKYFYDREGKRAREEMYVNDNLITYKEYTSEGYVKAQITNKYNEAGLKEAMLSTYGYNEHGLNETSTLTWVFGKDTTRKQVFHTYFNQHNQPDSLWVSRNEHGYLGYLKRYNKYGDLIELKESGGVDTYEYDAYDEKQNWGIRNFFTRGEPYYRWEREITYYEN